MDRILRCAAGRRCRVAPAADPAPWVPSTRDFGNGPDRNEVAATLPGAVTTAAMLGRDAPPHAFVYSPIWFTGTGFTVEQRYAAGPLIAGHWQPAAPGIGGPEQAAGQASVISGATARGGRAVLFGTEPLLRAHPKGLYAEVARALYWSAG